jgi:hypothetical protein
MKKLSMCIIATILFSACSNLKTKSLSKEESYQKNTIVVTHDLTTVKQVEETEETLFETNQWNKTNKEIFIENCIPVAEKNVGNARAKQVCDCLLEKMKQAYPNPNDMMNMAEGERESFTAQCNDQE